MERLTAIILALITYVTSLTTAVPALFQDLQDGLGKHITWMFTQSDISDVPYDEVYNYYQENFISKEGYKNANPADYPDLTEDYTNLLNENLKTAMQWKLDPGKGQINFYNAVKNYGMWDYKRFDAHPDWYSKTRNGIFTAYGVVMDMEILGNINFAFTGAAVGFSEIIIRTGGGLVNVLNGYAKWDEIKYYYDTQEDSDWIVFGVGLYKLYDKDYEDESSLVDNTLTIIDPRFIGGAILIRNEIEANNGQLIIPSYEEIKGAVKAVLAEYGIVINVDDMSYAELLEILNSWGVKI